MNTLIVEPSVGLIFGFGVSAQPKFVTIPETVATWPGVSIVPNGNTLPAFCVTIVLNAMTVLPTHRARDGIERHDAVPRVRQEVAQDLEEIPPQVTPGYNKGNCDGTSGLAPSIRVAASM
jgi:hypothetical protein